MGEIYIIYATPANKKWQTKPQNSNKKLESRNEKGKLFMKNVIQLNSAD